MTASPAPRRLAYLTLQDIAAWQGAHTHVNEVVQGLRRKGWDVVLFAPTYAAGSTPSVAQRAIAFLRLQLTLWRQLKSVDVVYVRHHPAAAPTALATRLAGVPRVEEVNGRLSDYTRIHPWTRTLRGPLLAASRLALRTAARRVAVSAELADYVRDLVAPASVDVNVVANGVDVEQFHPQVAPDPSLPSSYVVFIGALSPWQGLDTLLAAERDPSWPADVDLVIVGDGVGRKAVERLAAESSRIHYLGPLPHDRVPAVLTGAMLSVSPKHSEAAGASPLKVYESMACGTPLIVTDIPEQAALVRRSGCGGIVPPKDPAALAQEVKSLAADPARRQVMARAGRTSVMVQHTWEQRVVSLEAMLSSVLPTS